MRAITLWQPWSSLMTEGHKKNETRSWPTNVRGQVAIHSAKKPFAEIKHQINPKSLEVMCRLLYPYSLNNLPLGYVLGIGNLKDCKLINEEFLENLDPTERLLGDYTPGRYAWIFEDVKHFKTPILAKGSQGFWNWEVPNGIEIA